MSIVKSIGRNLRQVTDPVTRRLIEGILNNIDILSNNVADIQAVELPAWKDITLKNGWVEIATLDAVTPQFFKSSEHIVFVRGIISSGTMTSGTVIATLPEGYRPLKIEAWPVVEAGGGGNARIRAYPNGDLQIHDVTANTDISIAGYFFAEN